MTPRTRHFDHAEASLDEFYTSDEVMHACLRRARVAARTDLPILILGESGAGKTILARAIHNSSARRGGPFIAFNAAALSETLLDSQLFGHERGAFTGAQQRVKGKFELAHEGTLFLDEVADLTAMAQSKILRAVETGEYERLGSETLQHADVRLISATNYRIDPGAQSGRFRHDLFFRISGITLTVPPLRARPNDLPLLLANEVARAAKAQGKSILGLSRAAAERLLAYRWPGNLRELSSVVHAAVALTEDEVIDEHLLLLLEDDASMAHAAGSGASVLGDSMSGDSVTGESAARESVARESASRPAASGQLASRPPGGHDGQQGAVPSAAASLPTSRRLREAMRAHIARVLAEVGGNKRRAARELGVARATLERQLRSDRVTRGRRMT